MATVVLEPICFIVMNLNPLGQQSLDAIHKLKLLLTHQHGHQLDGIAPPAQEIIHSISVRKLSARPNGLNQTDPHMLTHFLAVVLIVPLLLLPIARLVPLSNPSTANQYLASRCRRTLESTSVVHLHRAFCTQL